MTETDWYLSWRCSVRVSHAGPLFTAMVSVHELVFDASGDRSLPVLSTKFVSVVTGILFEKILFLERNSVEASCYHLDLDEGFQAAYVGSSHVCMRQLPLR